MNSPEKRRYHLHASKFLISITLKYNWRKKLTNWKCGSSASKPKTLHTKRNQNKIWSIDIRDSTARRRATMYCDQLSSRVRSSARLNFTDSPAQVCLHLQRGGRQYDHVRCVPRKGGFVAQPLHCSTIYRNIIYYILYRFYSNNNIMYISYYTYLLAKQP